MNLRPPDISPSGMLIHTSREFPEGAVLKLGFRFSRSSDLIEARAELGYWLRRVGIGVEFMEIAPKAVLAIEKETSNVV